MSKFRRALSTAGTLALVANALDLSTSALPTQIDGNVPSRSPLAMLLQCALLALLMWRARRTPVQWLRRLRALPVPRPAACLLFAFVAGELAHVALRMEIYPFSSVAMFSSLAPSSQAQPTYAGPRRRLRLAVARGGRP